MFRGLRVRMGLHAGLTDPHSWAVNKATGRWCASGEANGEQGIMTAAATCDGCWGPQRSWLQAANRNHSCWLLC